MKSKPSICLKSKEIVQRKEKLKELQKIMNEKNYFDPGNIINTQTISKHK